MRILISFIFLFVSGFVNAGTATISGRVTDPSGQPLEFVVVTLLDASDSSLVKGALTNSDGEYLLENIPAGKFILSSSFTGFAKQWSEVPELKEGEQLRLPDIAMQSSKEMETVTIVSAQPLFVQKPGMLVMNIENSPVRMSGTAFDLLKKAPGVFVDQNSAISLKGKSGVQVYVDGKNTYLSGEQLQNYLQAIPAQDVVRIEIITNPSAKYDAEGNAGIINIITQKGTRQGFNGSVYGGGAQGIFTRSFAGMNCNYGRPKYNLYAKYDFGAPRFREDHNIYKSVTYEGRTSYYTQRTLFSLKPLVHTARMGVDFTPDENTSWGLRIDGSRDVENIGTDNVSLVAQPDSGTSQQLHQVNTLRGRFNSAGAGAYWHHTLDSSGREVSASADYLLYVDRTNETYGLHFTDANGAEISSPVFQRSSSSNDIRIYVAQLDYTHPFRKKYKLETGLKSSYVTTGNALLFEIEDNSGWNKDTTRSNTFTYIEQINAAYINASASLKKWELMAGLRAEQTVSDGISPTMNEEVKRSYIEFFPSVFVTQKINEKNTLNYSVSRRINRPDYGSLNPFLFYLDQFTYKAGNPFLQPEIAWNADLGYSFSDFFFVNASLSRKNQGMTDISRQVDSTGIIYQTTVNLNTVDMAYLGFSVSHNITKWWINETNLSFTYARYQSDLYGTGFDNHNVTYNADATETFLLAKGWKFQVSGWYQSQMYYGIFIFEPMGAVDAGLSKNFFDNKLQCSLNASDIFHTRILNISVNYDQQDIHVHHIPDSQVVTLRLRYNFGNAKAARKSQFESGADELKQRAG